MGMKVCVIDANGVELAYYPERYGKFCEQVRSVEQLEKRCLECDKRAMANCLATGEMSVQTCHAGLIECWIPLKITNRVSGFIVLGQIKVKGSSDLDIVERVKEYSSKEKLLESVKELIAVSQEKITSCANILQACVSYEIFKDILEPSENSLKKSIEDYVENNIDNDLSTTKLMSVFNMSRVMLYGTFKELFNSTPANYVKTKRLYYAKKLLLSGKYQISEIADACGIGDYNYFSKLFKKHFKKSPRQVKKEKI